MNKKKEVSCSHCGQKTNGEILELYGRDVAPCRECGVAHWLDTGQFVLLAGRELHYDKENSRWITYS